MKQFFVYIIYSKSHRIYYKGFTENPEQRIKEHNENMSRFTSGKGPWELVYLHSFPTKKEALIAEKKLKRAGSDYLQRLILEYINKNT